MKVLHLLYQSIPDVSGSSIRSKNLIDAQHRIGLDIDVITSPFQKGIQRDIDSELIDEVKYYRSYIDKNDFQIGKKKSLFKRFTKILTLFRFMKHVEKLCIKNEYDIIHCHAHFYMGFTGLYLKKKLGVKICYEVRSVWYECDDFKGGLLQRKFIHMLEQICISKSDRLFVISNGLKQYYKKPASIVYNAVDLKKVNYIKPVKRDVVFGYIGSILSLEGLTYVLHTLKEIQDSGFNNIFKIYGYGNYENQLKDLSEELELKNVEFLGLIKNDEIYKAYSEIDVIVNYRNDEFITRTVTPLKPIEAMAYKKIVISSDVAGIQEITDGHGVVVDSNNSKKLFHVMKDIILNYENYKDDVIKNYNYVKSNRTWESNAKLYRDEYTNLLK